MYNRHKYHVSLLRHLFLQVLLLVIPLLVSGLTQLVSGLTLLVRSLNLLAGDP
jgi:uncharacterized membrane protein